MKPIRERVRESATSDKRDRAAASDLRPATRAVAFLAILTAVLYLRALTEQLLAVLRSNGLGSAEWLTPALLLLGSAGLVLVWRHEAVGGLIALFSGLGLAIGDYSASGRYQWLVSFLYSSPFIVAGSMCLLCWVRQRVAGSREVC